MGILPTLFPSGLPLADDWTTDGVSNESIVFPYDGTVVAEAPVGEVAHAERALEAALAVQPEVAALSAGVRRSILLDVAADLEQHRAELEDLLVLETGKPLRDCRTEVDRTLFTWHAAAEAVAQLRGETVPLDIQSGGEGLIGYWTRKPIGVVIGIAGFNYPLLLSSHKIAPSIAAGCAVICKPAPQTPLATLWLVHLVREVLRRHGAPLAAVQLVTGGPDVGRTLTTDPRIGAVSFTGSAAVGHQIARDCAPRKALLELGSNAALVVAHDADLAAAANAAVQGGFYANGQACISVQRVIVEAAVVDEFSDLVAQRMADVSVGDPRDESTQVAALIDERSTERVLEWIAEAVDGGARVVSGGGRRDTALEPTVLTDVPQGARVWDEEIFGPVICIQSVPDFDAAVAAVNHSRYGLQAAVFTNSLKTAFRAVEEFEVGGVIVNHVPGYRNDVMPYGGVKDSGIGREGPRFAAEELTVTRMAVIRP
ncbi:aldehyde dehydrogenase family protein [Microbacterium esteraromaticum]|uniref:aldehyde dehydrogenase family protein n=1 Tax=Microbacterium esteraromaticum TaxID=57043 RepID=UPI001CD5429A|nr:aldehyde dehydrogenase family protein [Microbacterium esteraromaticum]MCA1305620.1 aldehyde dehydrogenase family protein [Microbacterium esteraromaticum]